MNKEPTRIKLTVAYDGTNYHGWQFQPNAVTIEGELKRAITELLNEEVTVIGASRTDTGVHALCNISVFDTTTPIPAGKLAFALNQRLPEDIRIQKSEAVDADFHPRRVESRKTYQYRIWNASITLPTKRLYHHFVHQKLDVDKMQTAASYLIGEHDFASFCTASPKKSGESDGQPKSTVRTIFSAEVKKQGDGSSALVVHKAEEPSPCFFEISITLTGNGFLYNMVRIIAGTLIDVGVGRYPPERITEILAAKDRKIAGPTAPPKGLTLVKYEYPPFEW